MLRFKKHDLIHNLVNINNTNTQKLYKTIMEIAGQNRKNPLPKSTTYQQLAKDLEHLLQ